MGFRYLQWCQGLFKSSQTQRRKQSLIALEETRTIDSDLQDQPVRVRHRPSAISLDRQGAREDLCLRMKYHLRNFLIGSLPAAWVQDNLVSFLQKYAFYQIDLVVGGGGMFDTGQQFVFNLGGGPGFRVHQFGGGRPRGRPREANQASDDRPQSAMSAITNLLPLLVLFLLPLLSTIFSSPTSPGPSFRFDSPEEPYTRQRTTPRHKVNYYINPKDVEDYTNRKLNELDRQAESKYVSDLTYKCQAEQRQKTRMIDEAQGWFFQDLDKMREAHDLEMKSCKRLEELGFAVY